MPPTQKIFLTFLFAFVCNAFVMAQPKQKFTVSGYVRDASNGEYSIGANVYLKETMKGVSTNQYGFFSLTADEGTYNLVISYLGYTNQEKKIILNKNLTLNFEIKPSVYTAKEVEITAEKADKNVKSTTIGAIKLDMAEIKKLPAFMGEVDVLKTVQLLPGVKSAGDGNSGFYVRGGGPDQNLILLDEAVVYNASHLLGFFSVFNGDAIKNINLVKGGMPAQYGGRLASVLDITMKDGNSKEYHAQGGIGVISSRLTVEGPIKKDTGSFIISARRTYIDAVARPFAKPGSPLREGSGYYFYDINGKANYRLSQKDRLFLSGYFGRDIMDFEDKKAQFNMGISWGNASGVLRWNHQFNNKLFVNTSAIVTNYKFDLNVEQTGFQLGLSSAIKDLNGKVDFSYYPSVRHEVKFGANYVFHTFTPITVSAKSGETDFNYGEPKKNNAHEIAQYISDDFEVTNKLKVHAGLRYSQFMQVGPFDRFITDSINIGQVVDTISYKKNQLVKYYSGLEPRLNARYELNNKSSVKVSYTRNLQYIHLASLSALTLPIDTWVSSTELVKPQLGNQYSAGYFRNFFDNNYESSVEVYYKDMKNQIEYKEGVLPSDDANNNADNQFTFGKGWAYGAEFFLKKRVGKFNGWAGYTISYTKRQFNEINNGKEYFARYDRRHDASLALNYDLTKQWSLAAIWVYGTGNAITVPVSYYFIDGNFVTEYGERNAFRMPAYHRLDLSATYTVNREKRLEKRKQKLINEYKTKGRDVNSIPPPKPLFKNYETSWTFSIFNVYNRHNPYIVFFATEGSIVAGDYQIKAKQMYLFPILPSVTWNFKF